MKRLGSILVLASALCLSFGGLALAEDDDDGFIPGGFSGNVGVYNNYVYRGVSRTNDKVAFQGGIDWSHDTGFYAGFWASNVEFDFDQTIPGSSDGVQIEIDAYGGYNGTFGDSGFGYTLGFLTYIYPTDDSLVFNEFNMGLSYSHEYFDTSVTYSITPESLRKGDAFSDSWHYIVGTLDIPIPIPEKVTSALRILDGVSIGGQAGYWNMSPSLGDYVNWDVGGTITVAGFDLDLRYSDTNLSAFSPMTFTPNDPAPRFVVGFSRIFE